MLRCEPLHARLCPSPFTGYGYDPSFEPIPGWTGLVEHVSCDLTGDGRDLDVFGAGDGGAGRVVGYDFQTGEKVVDLIVLDPAFRGGINLAATGHQLIATPQAGGGPVAAVLSPDGRGGVAVRDLALPYDPAFRGGIKVTTADVNGDGKDDLVCLPGLGGGPQLAAVDPDTGATLASFLVGPESDRSGLYGFAPAGAGVQLPGKQLGLYVQYGDDPATTHAYTWGGAEVG